MFKGINENGISPFLFSTTIRSLLVDNILRNIKLCHHKRLNLLNELKVKFKLKNDQNIDEEDDLEKESDQGKRIKFHKLK